MHENIPFLDVGATYRELRADLDKAIISVLESGWYLLGEELAAFEQEFAAYTETKHCVGLANGLEGLTLSLKALGVQAGDEVIVAISAIAGQWAGVAGVRHRHGAVEVRVDSHATSAPQRDFVPVTALCAPCFVCLTRG